MATTLQERLDWLDDAREAGADLGFLGRMLAPPAFQSRSPAPSAARAFGCLLALACHLSRLAEASQPPERLTFALRAVCHGLAHAATARPCTRLRFVLPLSGFAVAAGPG